MKCPHCGERVSWPRGKLDYVEGVPVIILYCPDCQAILGAVNAPET